MFIPRLGSLLLCTLTMPFLVCRAQNSCFFAILYAKRHGVYILQPWFFCNLWSLPSQGGSEGKGYLLERTLTPPQTADSPRSVIVGKGSHERHKRQTKMRMMCNVCVILRILPKGGIDHLRGGGERPLTNPTRGRLDKVSYHPHHWTTIA